MDKRRVLVAVLAAVLIGAVAAGGLFLRDFRERRLPVSSLTYAEIEARVSRGTDLTQAQLDDYISSIRGKRVRWKGEVEEVDSDYRVFVDLDGFFYDVEFPLDREAALSLKRGQEIVFVGIIDRIERYLLSCRLTLRNVQIEENQG